VSNPCILYWIHATTQQLVSSWKLHHGLVAACVIPYTVVYFTTSSWLLPWICIMSSWLLYSEFVPASVTPNYPKPLAIVSYVLTLAPPYVILWPHLKSYNTLDLALPCPTLCHTLAQPYIIWRSQYDKHLSSVSLTVTLAPPSCMPQGSFATTGMGGRESGVKPGRTVSEM